MEIYSGEAMRLLSYLGIQIRLVIFRKRWLLPFPVMLFIAFRSVNAIRSLLELHVSTTANIWDVFFITFGNGWNMILIITNLFLFLVCDLLPEPGFGQLALLRLGSRRMWWLAKCLILAISVIAYAVLAVGIVVTYAAFSYSMNLDWSSLALATPESLNIPFFTPRNASAPAVIGQILLLLMLGWFCLGLLMMVVTQLSRRFLVGYITALVVLFGSFAVSWVSNPVAWTSLFIYKHLMFNHFPLPFRDIPVNESVIYWMFWLLLLASLGLVISRRQDYLAMRSQV
jgi:hypothetical protein